MIVNFVATTFFVIWHCCGCGDGRELQLLQFHLVINKFEFDRIPVPVGKNMTVPVTNHVVQEEERVAVVLRVGVL